MAIEVHVRQWGNSKAIILPRAFVEQRKIKTGDRLVIEPIKKADLRNWFGKYPKLPPGQEVKNEGRDAGWK